MTAPVTKVTREHFFVVLLGFLAVFSLGNESWSYPLTQNQTCYGNCGGLERLDTSASSQSLDARPLSFTSSDRHSDAQSMDLSSGSDIRSTTPGSNLAQYRPRGHQRAGLQESGNRRGKHSWSWFLPSCWFGSHRRADGYLPPVEEIEEFGYGDALAARPIV